MLCIASVLLAQSVEASQYIDHEKIRVAVKEYLIDKTKAVNYGDTQIEVGQIDNRLKLSTCDTKLDVQLGNSRLPGNISVSVGCSSNKPWKIYIQATVKAYQDIYIAKRSITRNAPIKSSDLILERRDITSLSGNYMTDFGNIDGHLAKRAIRKHETIKPFHLIKSKLIKRGEQVTIIAETAGISVRMQGKAMNDAAIGDNVKVKNNNSKRIVEGIATQRGIVKISL